MKVGWKLGQQSDQGIVDNLVRAAEPTRQLAPLRGSQKELWKRNNKITNPKLEKVPKLKYNHRNRKKNEPDKKEPEGRSRPDAR